MNQHKAALEKILALKYLPKTSGDSKINMAYDIAEQSLLEPLDDGQEGRGLPKFLVIKDDNGTFEIWDKNRYETYVRKATDYGATPAVKIVVGFNGNEDFLFPLPSAVTGGVKDAVGFINWAMDNNYQCKLKNITGGYEWYIDDEDGVPVDYLSPEQLYQVYLSEGQPAQEKCPRCKGEGTVEKNVRGWEGEPEYDTEVECPECGGKWN